MKIRKLAMAVVAVLALYAFGASIAQAEAGSWTVEGAELSGSAEVRMYPANSATAIELSSPGRGVKLTAGGIECVGCTIYNNGTAHGAGRLALVGIEVDEPEGCVVVAKTIKTKALEYEVIMSGGATYVEFFPAEGSTILTVQLTECAAAGKYKVTGTVAGLFSSGTGFEAFAQALRFQGNTAGAKLQFGGTEAALMGEVNVELGGGHALESFTAHS